MRRISLLAVAILLVTSISFFAPRSTAAEIEKSKPKQRVAERADLEKIDRAIGKLPKFSADKQAYGLLVFGPEARTHVWLVRDGDLLYVDRNANGDLTEPNERVEAEASSSQPEEGVYVFKVGEVADGDATHKDLRVYWTKVDHLRNSMPDVAEALKRDPDFRGCSVTVDVLMPDQRGAGIDGRVSQSVTVWDADGLLEFGEAPAEAPVLHFGGPWEITLASRESAWQIGRTQKVYLVMGTRGIGPGSTVDIAYENVVPPGIAPTLKVSFPPASPGQADVVHVYELKQRCCTVNLYGDVEIPKNVGTGKAKVEISIEPWPGALVMPTMHVVEIAEPPPGPKRQPVSPRLIRRLEHEHPRTSICSVQFSPDGKRLIAGDYPGGVVHVWDVESGKRLTTFDIGKGLRSTLNYFLVSPDWTTIYGWKEKRGQFQKRERDGKTFYRVQFETNIESWDLDTGKHLRTYRRDPARGIRVIHLDPSGRYLLATEEVPGEFEKHRPRALSLWDTVSGDVREVEKGNAFPGPFSKGGRLVAVSGPSSDNSNVDSIKICSVPDWNEQCKIAFEDKRCNAKVVGFVSNDKLLMGTVLVYEKENDWQHFNSFLKLWDSTTGEALVSIPAPERDQYFGFAEASPASNMVLATSHARSKGGQDSLFLVDVQKREWKPIDLPHDALVRKPIVHPSGKWAAVSTQVMTPTQARSEDPPEELEQPTIAVISLPDGELLETLVAPPANILSGAFSPDGTLLATSGHGEVLLWDFREPPGQTQSESKGGE